MEFGICFDTHIDKWDLIRYVEELGYDRAWVPDSQMIWSDCYASDGTGGAGHQAHQDRHRGRDSAVRDWRP